MSAYLHRNLSDSENISAYVDIRTAYVHIIMKPYICGISMATLADTPFADHFSIGGRRASQSTSYI